MPTHRAIPKLVALVAAVVSAWTSSAHATHVVVVSNEGQQTDQAVDRLFFTTNVAVPGPPSIAPPNDVEGHDWTDAAYEETASADGSWRNALPVFRFEDWPIASLPRDAAGDVRADWLWSSSLPEAAMRPLLIPDTDNGTRFERRFSATVQAGRYANGYLPGVVDGAVHARRLACLPLNARRTASTMTVLADSQARVQLNGALVHDTCSLTPAECARDSQRGYVAPTPFSPAWAPGANVLTILAWTWQIDAPFGGLLYHAEFDYETDPLDVSVESVSAASGEVTVAVRATAPVPAGAFVQVRTASRFVEGRLNATDAAGLFPTTFGVGALAPGERVDAYVDGLDCGGRPAGGPQNLLGGAAQPVATVYGAIGALEETDETNNARPFRLPPVFDAQWSDRFVATPTITLTGASAAGTRVRIDRGSSTVGTVDANGDFQIDVTLALGTNTFVAYASADGLDSGASEPITITYDPSVPARPEIDHPVDGSTLDTPRVEIRGHGGTAGALVIVTLDGSDLCSTAPASDGTWSCGEVDVGAGLHVATARQRSRAGIEGEADTARFTIEFPVDAGPPEARPLYLGGDGGCASAGAGAVAFVVACAALLFSRRRRKATLLVLFCLTTPAAAQTAEIATFPGPTPRVSGPWHTDPLKPAVALAIDFARRPLVLRELGTGTLVTPVVSDQLGLRAVASMGLTERVAISLSLPMSPWMRTGGAIPSELLNWGDATPLPGVADVGAAVMVDLARGRTASLALALKGTFPTGSSMPLGAGQLTAAAGLVAGFESAAIRGGLELLGRTGAKGSMPTVDLRAGLVGPWRASPFAQVVASVPVTNAPFEKAAMSTDVGIRVAATPSLSVSISAGRGLNQAAGSPAFLSMMAIEYVPLARPPLPEPMSTSLVPHAPAAPTILFPEEGEVLKTATVGVDGYGEPFARVLLSIDGGSAMEVDAEPDGTFRFRLTGLTPGAHQLSASQAIGELRGEAAVVRSFVVEIDDSKPRAAEQRAAVVDQILRYVSEQSQIKARETPEGVALSTSVYFGFDKWDIREEDAPRLRQLAKVIRAFPNLRVRIDSHTDSTGTPAYNLKLSQRRAESGRRFLVEQEGIDPARITCVGYGDTRPVASNATLDGRAKNRRFAEAVFLIP